MSRKIGLRWFDYAGLALVILLAAVLIVEQAHAGRMLNLIWFMRDWGW